MLDTRLLNTTDLIDAALSLLDAQEQQRLAQKQHLLADDALDDVIGEGLDRLEALIESCLNAEDSQTLADAVQTLQDAQRPQASEFLEATIESCSCRTIRLDGTVQTAKLIPVIVSKQHCNEHGAIPGSGRTVQEVPPPAAHH